LALNSAFYKEHVGRDHLQRKFQSNQVFTPAKIDRCTISEDNYKRYFNATPRASKTPWGRHRSYGGLGTISLPVSNRPKGEPPTIVEKGHLHYGAGVMPHPSKMTVKQFYTLTPLTKSIVRSNDELIPSPNQENITKLIPDKKFPAEHPYSSHSSRFSLFPQFDTPTDMYKGKPHHIFQPTLPPETPAAVADTKVLGKSRGTPARHEQVSAPMSSARSPLRWIDGPNFFQLPKGPSKEKQSYYPIPPSTVRPASGAVLKNTAVSLNTAAALNDIQKSMWESTYEKDFKNHLSVESENEKVPRDCASRSETGSVSPHTQHYLPSKSPTSPRCKSSMESDSTEDIAQEGLESGAISEPTTPKSVQFNRSVTFSDGMNIREIPLTSGSDPTEYRARTFLKTPFPRSTSQIGTGDGGQMAQTEGDDTPIGSGLSKGTTTSVSINHMPSQTIVEEIIGDPACPLKYFRPHTVGNYRSSTEVLKVRDNWSRSAASRRFHQQYPEPTPDLRRKPDLRLTTNEKRHIVPEAKAHTYIFRGADHF